MQVWIALFRGINVSGKNIVPMADLRALMSNIGFEGAKTYIQSGNLVFQSADDNVTIRKKITDAVADKFGFEPRLMLLSVEAINRAIHNNPFPAGEADPKTLHLYFLNEAPENTDLAAMAGWKIDSEAYELQGDVFYLHAPDGIGRSKLAERVERLLGVGATARNWRSVSKILALAQGF